MPLLLLFVHLQLSGTVVSTVMKILCQDDEKMHQVRITRPFLIGKFEVSQGEFEQVTRGTPSWFSVVSSHILASSSVLS